MESPKYELSHHARRRVENRKIKVQWIDLALTQPDRVEPDKIDPNALHSLKKIAELEDRVLRVVYDPNVSPIRIISVHFDRRLRVKL